MIAGRSIFTNELFLQSGDQYLDKGFLLTELAPLPNNF